jgi:hypothetical protein
LPARAALSKAEKEATYWSVEANRTSVLPQHGGKTQLGKGLWLKILKDLGLRER